MDRSDLSFRNGGNARNHAYKIAWLDRVGTTDVECEPDHPSFVRNRARFFARAGMGGAFAAVRSGTFVLIAASLAPISCGRVRTIGSKRAPGCAAILRDVLPGSRFVVA